MNDKELYSRIIELINKHDPAQLFGHGAPEDEYTGRSAPSSRAYEQAAKFKQRRDCRSVESDFHCSFFSHYSTEQLTSVRGFG